MRVLCCGSRNWVDRELIKKQLKQLPKDTVIIHGNCRGADRIAAFVGKQLGIEVDPYPAKWTKYGNAAGPIRNQQMLDEGKPDSVFAFHDQLLLSKGTADMVNKAKKAGIPVTVFAHAIDTRRRSS